MFEIILILAETFPIEKKTNVAFEKLRIHFF